MSATVHADVVPPAPVDRHARWIAVLVCWLLIVFDGYDLIVFGTVKPALMEEWDVSQATAGTVGSSAFLGMMIGAVFAGRLSDGVYPVFMLFAGAAAVSTVLQFALLPVIRGAGRAPRLVRPEPTA
ncbi:hypothetical protein ACH9D2_17825 [Kocuria sp. M4R2S49]|uniref:hypothetical protein n=1 Tax=Kocuria rhizosphaericola TaxID=3376284 RepID=UPI003799B1C9